MKRCAVCIVLVLSELRKGNAWKQGSVVETAKHSLKMLRWEIEEEEEEGQQRNKSVENETTMSKFVIFININTIVISIINVFVVSCCCSNFEYRGVRNGR